MTDLVTMTMPTDHKAKQRQKLGWFRFPKKLKTAFFPFPVWQFSAKLIKTVKGVLKVTVSHSAISLTAIQIHREYVNIKYCSRLLETGSMGFLQINTKYSYLPEHKLTGLYLWQKITHISLTNTSVIPVLVITFSLEKADTALQNNCHNCYLLKCIYLQYLN